MLNKTLEYCNNCKYLEWDLVNRWHCKKLYPWNRVLSYNWYAENIVRPEECIQEEKKRKAKK